MKDDGNINLKFSVANIKTSLMKLRAIKFTSDISFPINITWHTLLKYDVVIMTRGKFKLRVVKPCSSKHVHLIPGTYFDLYHLHLKFGIGLLGFALLLNLKDAVSYTALPLLLSYILEKQMCQIVLQNLKLMQSSLRDSN